MRVPHKQQEPFMNSFSAQKIAIVKVKCLLLAAIDAIDNLQHRDILPYRATLYVINGLIDDDKQRAFREINDFNYRLERENHPCGEKIEDYVHRMAQTINQAQLLAESDS